MASSHPTWNLSESHYSRDGEAMITIVAKEKATLPANMHMRKRFGPARAVGWRNKTIALHTFEQRVNVFAILKGQFMNVSRAADNLATCKADGVDALEQLGLLPRNI